jgi:C_GCAxxG_C_C family probable redox protein
MTTILRCSKEEMIVIAEREFGRGAEGRCCSEAVLLAACAALGVKDNEVIPSIAVGFGGGMGLTGRVCGAFSGAIMAVGIATDKTTANYAECQGKAFRAVADYL